MKCLILIRHADACPRSPGQADMDRVLSARGEREAQAAGVALRERQATDPIGIMVASPAARTLATARRVAATIGLPQDAVHTDMAVYGATASELADRIAAWPAALERAALVGHNPAISELAFRLAASPVGVMRTGAVYAFSLDAATWAEAVRRRAPAEPISRC